MKASWFAIGPNPDWDDYRRILVCGMCSYLSRQATMLRYLRFAPPVPPMVVSGIGHVIVTNQMRSVLEGVSGVSEFRSVIK